MVTEYFRPDLVFSFEKWDEITHKKKDGLTWTMAGLMWFKQNAFDVVDIEPFDYREFIARGKEYLTELYGKEIADIQEKMSDIEQEREITKEFIKEISVERRSPTIGDITRHLDNGYLVAMNVNARSLNDKKGYAGHFVVVKGYTQDALTIHDSGLPPLQNRSVSFTNFMRAWADPNDQALNLIALRH